jgi:hypothetical protein
MTISLFGKNFEDLQSIGRTYASQLMTSSANALQAAARFLDGIAERIASRAATSEETSTGAEPAPEPAAEPVAEPPAVAAQA